MIMYIFRLALLEEAKKFLQSLPPQAYKKILYNIDRVAGGERNKELFKKLENSEIWEFRTFYNGIAYRLFAFWDTDMNTLVVATHGIIKKTQKTPKKEIARAEAIMKQYFEIKNK
ncbi:MAG: type II toxin-antitoxin system RelE/ParE family toxin [Bacteroidales bacterium]|nr:type II toxin-antitoxin system RelE/ParE family toxin [Bacteroidales bacterium]